MRILVLADIRFPIERANGIQTIETCHALARRHRVTLLVRPDTATPARDPFAFYGLDRIPGLTLARVPVFGPLNARRAQYVAAAAVRALIPGLWDLVWTRDLGVADLLLRVPRALRPPVYYESHGFAPMVASERPDLLTGAERASDEKLARLHRREARVWRHADGYATITRALADELESSFGPRRKLAVIPDGVRLTANRRYVPRERGNPPVVGYAGHLYPWKGVNVLLHALAMCRDLRGVIVGGHPAEHDLQRLQHLAKTAGIESRVVFTGQIEPHRVAAAMADMDVLVLPNVNLVSSVSYTSPLKMFEYMAAARPIVASDLPAIREVLVPEENALLFPPGQPRQLADCLRRLVDDPGLADRLARRAFEDVGQYSWDRRADKIDDLIESKT